MFSFGTSDATRFWMHGNVTPSPRPIISRQITSDERLPATSPEVGFRSQHATFTQQQSQQALASMELMFDHRSPTKGEDPAQYAGRTQAQCVRLETCLVEAHETGHRLQVNSALTAHTCCSCWCQNCQERPYRYSRCEHCAGRVLRGHVSSNKICDAIPAKLSC